MQAPKKIIDVEHGKPECINMHRTEHMGPICIRGSHDPIIKNATLHVFDKNQNICTSVNLEAACTILNDSDQPSNLELENSKISFTDGTVQNVTITITNQEVPEGTYVLRMEPIDFSDFKLAPFQKPFKSFNEIERKRKYETLSDALNKCLQEEQSLKSRIDNNQEAMNRADGSCQQALESFTQQINLYNVTHKENCSANGEDIPDFSEMVERHKDVMRDSARRRQKGRKVNKISFLFVASHFFSFFFFSYNLATQMRSPLEFSTMSATYLRWKMTLFVKYYSGILVGTLKFSYATN